MVIELESEGRRKTKKDWFYVKSHRSKILNYVIIYKLQLYKYKYNGLKFYYKVLIHLKFELASAAHFMKNE